VSDVQLVWVCDKAATVQRYRATFWFGIDADIRRRNFLVFSQMKILNSKILVFFTSYGVKSVNSRILHVGLNVVAVFRVECYCCVYG
jgi:hypothetical protein